MSVTSIEWTDRNWPWARGCSMARGSELGGCLNCYAARMAARFPWGRGFARNTENGPRWTGKVELQPQALDEPLRVKKPQRWFPSTFDPFHESLKDEEIDRAFAVMALAEQHTFQILTKRAARMQAYLSDSFTPTRIAHAAVARPEVGSSMNALASRVLWGGSEKGGFIPLGLTPWPLPNVWAGVSVENPDQLKRVDHLKDTPAALRFVSFEPLLDDLGELILDGIHWAIFGGESGPGARRCNVAWIRRGVRQCRRQGVAPFVKQLGANVIDRNDVGFEAETEVWAEGPDAGRPTNPSAWPTPHGGVEDNIDGTRDDYQGAPVRVHLKSSKGGDPSEWPSDLRVREFPKVPA